jgi:hypothetical protein
MDSSMIQERREYRIGNCLALRLRSCCVSHSRGLMLFTAADAASQSRSSQPRSRPVFGRVKTREETSSRVTCLMVVIGPINTNSPRRLRAHFDVGPRGLLGRQYGSSPFLCPLPGLRTAREHGDAAKCLKQWFGDTDALVLLSSSVEAVEDRGMSRSNARTARCATGRSIGWICCARDFDPIRRAFPSGRERPPASLITSQGLTPQRGGDDRCQTSVLTWDGTRVNTPRLNRSCSCAI